MHKKFSMFKEIDITSHVIDRLHIVKLHIHHIGDRDDMYVGGLDLYSGRLVVLVHKLSILLHYLVLPLRWMFFRLSRRLMMYIC